MIEDVLPYLAAFLAPLVVTLLATPVVRELNRRVSRRALPDARTVSPGLLWLRILETKRLLMEAACFDRHAEHCCESVTLYPGTRETLEA